MKRLFGSWACVRLGLALAVFSGGVFLIGCDGGGGPVGPKGGDNTLTLPTGYAWVDTGNSDKGVIFTKDGRFFGIYKGFGKSWWIEREGVYTTADDIEMKIAFSASDTGVLLFKILDGGNTLKLYRKSGARPPLVYEYQYEYVYTKTSGVNVTIPPANPGTGGNLVLGKNEAWINTADGGGFIFQSDSTVLMIGGANGVWVLSDTGKYSTKDGHIKFPAPTIWGSGEDVRYTVSGNSLVITWSVGNATVFAKTSNITVSPHAGGTLVLSQGQAWVNGIANQNGTGFIFESNGKFSAISGNNGVWELVVTGVYTALGSNVEIIAGAVTVDTLAGMYTVSGNSLILTFSGQTIVFTKKSGISFTTPKGGNLVLPSGQAWTYDNGSYGRVGYIFQADGQILLVRRDADGSWQTEESGTYETNGGVIRVDMIKIVSGEHYYYFLGTGTYSVSGDSLTLHLSDEVMNLTRTSGVTVRNNAPAVSPDPLKKSGKPAAEKKRRFGVNGLDILEIFARK